MFKLGIRCYTSCKVVKNEIDDKKKKRRGERKEKKGNSG